MEAIGCSGGIGRTGGIGELYCVREKFGCIALTVRNGMVESQSVRIREMEDKADILMGSEESGLTGPIMKSV